MSNNIGNVDQIREIIIGPQIREFKKQLEELNTKINDIKKYTEQKLNTIQKEVKRESKAAMTLLEQKINNLSEKTKDEASYLKEEILKNEKRLNKTIETVKDEMDTKLSLLQEDMEDNVDNLKKEMNELNTQLREELGLEMQIVDEAKISRENFAEMLIDMAMKIQGKDIISDIQMAEISNLVEEEANKANN